MKCPNCGCEIKEGHLYCETCGTEIQMVPDFEPEIENSIMETLSNLAEGIRGKNRAEKIPKGEKTPKTGRTGKRQESRMKTTGSRKKTGGRIENGCLSAWLLSLLPHCFDQTRDLSLRRGPS